MIDIANHAADQWRRRVDPDLSFTEAREAIQQRWPAAHLYYETGEKTVFRSKHKSRWVYFVVQDEIIMTVMTDAQMRQTGSAQLVNQAHTEQRVRHHQHRAQRRAQTHALRRR